MDKEKRLTPSLPKGFQNKWVQSLFLKKELLRIIEKYFIKFGYSPLETSPMQLSSIIGNTLSEDEENPMSDIYTFSDDGIDVSLRYDLSQPLINFYKQKGKSTFYKRRKIEGKCPSSWQSISRKIKRPKTKISRNW